MLRFNETDIKKYITKYKEKVLDRVTSPIFSTVEEGTMHTRYISDCSRGSDVARNYMLNTIKSELSYLISGEDKKKIFTIAKEHINTFFEKQYEIEYDIEFIGERKVSYLTFAKEYLSESQKRSLDEWRALGDTDNLELSLEILTYEIYKLEYGLDAIDELFLMDLNNIEVHDTKKIRVESIKGIWYTIDDLRFSSNKTIQIVAQRLVSQGAGADLTEEDCEREFMLLNGARGTIALKPASYLDHIFIKKFDSFDLKSMEDLIDNETILKECVEDMQILAKGRANLVVGGGVNVGKSTFYKAYVSLIPDKYKIGMVDSSKDTDIINMYPDKDIIILYETNKYSLAEQFRRLLRMNRHIVIITEARSYEIEHAIKAMTRANRGSGLTIHFGRLEDLVDEVSYMILENGINQDIQVLRARVSNAIDIGILMRELSDGRKIVDKIGEIVLDREKSLSHTINYMYKYSEKENKLIREPEYKVSKDLEEILRYHGVTDSEIKKLNREV